MRRGLDLMSEFIVPLYKWLQQFTNHYLTHYHLLRLDTRCLAVDICEPHRRHMFYCCVRCLELRLLYCCGLVYRGVPQQCVYMSQHEFSPKACKNFMRNVKCLYAQNANKSEVVDSTNIGL
jgi:hypothetical protein